MKVCNFLLLVYLLSWINELLVEQNTPSLQDHGLILWCSKRDFDTERRRASTEQGFDVAQRSLGHRGDLNEVFDAQVKPVCVVGVDSRFGRLLLT